MRLDVDKARGHREPAGIDDPLGVLRQVGSDLGDASGLDRHVRAPALAAAAVDHRAATDQDVPDHDAPFPHPTVSGGALVARR
jgi:hypothetical protein